MVLDVVANILGDPNSGVRMLAHACNMLRNQISHHSIGSGVSLAGLGSLDGLLTEIAVRTAKLVNDSNKPTNRTLFLVATRLLCYVS